ncbi:MAG: right-handed parallel beta-helix repeat-containing protein [Pirellulaceae bacterium]
MHYRLLFLLIIASTWHAHRFSAPILAAGETVFHVRDFGAVPDGKTPAGDAIRAAIDAALAAPSAPDAPVAVVLDAGEYLVQHEDGRGYCFPIHRAAHLTVRGAGTSTKIVIADPTLGGFLFGLCHHVAVRHLVIDYNPVPFCQGKILSVDVENGNFELDVEEGFPTPDAENFLKAHEPYGKWGMIMDPDTRRIRSGTPDHYMTPRWEHVAGRIWRFFTEQEHYRRHLAHMRVGDFYVHLARGYGSAVTAQGCEGIRIENVIVHASPGLAVGLVGNRGEILVRGLEVRFPSKTNRLLTTDADGVHCQQNRCGPMIEDCYFEGMADDAINIYAPPNVLREIRSPTQWLVSPNCLVLPGDRLQVLDPRTGRLRGEVRATDVKVEGRAFLITIDAQIEGAVAGDDHRVADTLYNMDACGAGFQIRRNHMRGNRRYGCLLRAGAGVVEDNTFEDTTGAGVVVINEPDWPEGPMPWGITIRGNCFLRGGTCLGYADTPHGAALSIRATRLGHSLAEAEAIRDVILENNTFQDRAGMALFVGGARNVQFTKNRITATPEAELRRNGPAILIQRSSEVKLADNTLFDPRPGTTAAVEIGPDVAPGRAGVEISGLQVDPHLQTQPVLDRRAAPSGS